MAGGADLKKIQWEYISYFQYSKKTLYHKIQGQFKSCTQKIFCCHHRVKPDNKRSLTL